MKKQSLLGTMTIATVEQLVAFAAVPMEQRQSYGQPINADRITLVKVPVEGQAYCQWMVVEELD